MFVLESYLDILGELEAEAYRSSVEHPNFLTKAQFTQEHHGVPALDVQLVDFPSVLIGKHLELAHKVYARARFDVPLLHGMCDALASCPLPCISPALRDVCPPPALACLFRTASRRNVRHHYFGKNGHVN